MGNTSPRVLVSLLLNTLLCCGQTLVIDPVLTVEPNWSTFYVGEFVTFICDMNEGRNTDCQYRLLRNGQEFDRFQSDKRFRVGPLYTGDSGEFQCCRQWRVSPDENCSKTVPVTVSDKPRAKLAAGSTTIPIGGSVTLSCSVEPSAGWKYRWFRRTSDSSFVEFSRNNEENREITVTQGGIYKCDGERGNPSFYSHSSLENNIEIMFSNKVFVTRRPIWPQMFSGESITLTCEVQGGETTEWTCEWRRSGSIIHKTDSKDWTFNVSESSSGNYMCQCRSRDDWYSSTQWSETIRLSVSNKPGAKLAAGSTTIPVGGSVTLSCSVEPSAGWKYRWFRRTSDTSFVEFNTNNEENREITVTQGGIYKCDGKRGNPSFYSHSSHENIIEIMFSNKVFVTRQPNWPLVFSGESITLTCEVQGGETTEWTCEWRRSGSIIQWTDSKDWTFNVSESSSGNYMCQCRSRDDWYSSTQWSETITVTVSSSSHLVLLISGPVVGFILIILLVLLCFCRRSKGLFCSRCKASESSRNDGVNQAGGHEYSSPLQEVTPTYAEINHQARANRKKKGSPAATDKTVYSGIRSGAALHVDSAM
ncbi:leukocyte immunoglobulin-like receptor subfamily B member 3-like isoform X1 [Xiphophorus maculatus]|uniref:leukocyte immunoglobulin-like receptor subfamily B member 3-like isoform X1 n=1 Tax=Xiphophorus maculatus TaxID=8083 RepID=UPI000C6E3659|nr:leukocyte immunoglobulin-like receptor subfamily B member 3-like isoform X1 [Xiphophorus maculatus]